MAITAEFAPCPNCKTNNSKAASACRHCHAPLPWAKGKAAKPSGGGVAVAQRSAPSAPAIDWGYWGVAVFSFMIPIIGYFLYRSYSENGDEKASAAGLGAIAGVAFHVIRVVYRIAT